MPEPEENTVYDVVIIGGGPAGLTCAIFLGRFRRRVIVVDSGKPRNYASQGIHGFLGFHAIKPEELIRRGREEAESVGVMFCDCVASKVERCGDHFEVTTDKQLLKARRVVLAYGVRDILPGITQIEDYYGHSVFHCPDCDGYECRDRAIGIIAGGDKAAGLALKLVQWSANLTIFTNGDESQIGPEEMSKLLAEGIGLRKEPIKSLSGNGGMVSAVVLSNGESVPIEAIFFSVGIAASCQLAEEIGCSLSEGGPYLDVNHEKETSVAGIYAAGDLVPGTQLAITSAADGAIVAIAINKSLLPPSRRV